MASFKGIDGFLRNLSHFIISLPLEKLQRSMWLNTLWIPTSGTRKRKTTKEKYIDNSYTDVNENLFMLWWSWTSSWCNAYLLVTGLHKWRWGLEPNIRPYKCNMDIDAMGYLLRLRLDYYYLLLLLLLLKKELTWQRSRKGDINNGDLRVGFH